MRLSGFAALVAAEDEQLMGFKTGDLVLTRFHPGVAVVLEEKDDLSFLTYQLLIVYVADHELRVSVQFYNGQELISAYSAGQLVKDDFYWSDIER